MTDPHQADPADFRLTRNERLKLRLSTILWFLLLTGMVLSLPVLMDFGWWAVLALSVLSVVASLPISWLIRRFARQKRSEGWRKLWLKTGVAIFSTLAILVAAPIYILAIDAAVRPMTVPLATLSNGRKTVVFQGMTHIGTQTFYKSVVYDLEQALTEGYVIFYEGVQDDPAADEWFSRTLAGGGDLSATYAAFGRTCGLDFQLDYFKLLESDKALHPQQHVAADVSSGDMKREYERLVRTDPSFAAFARSSEAEAAHPGENASERVARLLTWLDRTTPGQKALIGTACRGLINHQLAKGESGSPINAVIIDFRNRELAHRIAESPDDKIYITYGAGHLPGLLRDLQAIDPAWDVRSIKWMRTIAAPDELKGRLQ